MRAHSLSLLACLVLAACATEDASVKRNEPVAVKKRPAPAASSPAKPRVVSPAKTHPGVPIDSIVIQHRNRGKANLLAAVGGALASSAAPEYMEQHAADLQRVLQTEVEQGEARIERRNTDQAVRISLTPDDGYDNLSSVVKPDFLATLNKIAPQLNQYGKTMITIISIIELTGPDAGNLKLAERRAKSVSDYFITQNVDALRLQSVARSDARTDNAGADAPPVRRVEVWIQPVLAS